MPLKMGMQVGLIAQRSQVLPFPPPYLMIPWMCYHFKNQVRETSRSKREGRDIFINQTCGRRWETSIPSPAFFPTFTKSISPPFQVTFPYWLTLEDNLNPMIQYLTTHENILYCESELGRTKLCENKVIRLLSSITLWIIFFLGAYIFEIFSTS